MKTIISSILILIASYATAQQSHTLIAFDHGYNPDSLYISSGDTVHFVSEGYHSATEVDSTDWENNNLNPNGGFDVGFGAPTVDTWFVVETSGKHYFMCRPHAEMGMKSVLFVDQTSGINEVFQKDDYKFFTLDDGSYQLEYKDSDQYEIYNLNGQIVSEGRLESTTGRRVISAALTPGTYVICFYKNGTAVISKKTSVIR